MEELHKIVKKKYKDFDITPQHLGQVIRDNNITRKRTRHEHYPKERYLEIMVINHIQLMNFEPVVCVQYVRKKQEDVKNSKSEKIQNHIKVVISQFMS